MVGWSILARALLWFRLEPEWVCGLSRRVVASSTPFGPATCLEDRKMKKLMLLLAALGLLVGGVALTGCPSDDDDDDSSVGDDDDATAGDDDDSA